jgi:hypothetical protein
MKKPIDSVRFIDLCTHPNWTPSTGLLGSERTHATTVPVGSSRRGCWRTEPSRRVRSPSR